MVEAADQIRSEIEAARMRLDYDISALEQRIKHEADWRVQMEHHPRAIVGMVFALAMLLGFVLGGRNRAFTS
jgi:hypothetical protein